MGRIQPCVVTMIGEVDGFAELIMRVIDGPVGMPGRVVVPTLFPADLLDVKNIVGRVVNMAVRFGGITAVIESWGPPVVNPILPTDSDRALAEALAGLDHDNTGVNQYRGDLRFGETSRAYGERRLREVLAERERDQAQ